MYGLALPGVRAAWEQALNEELTTHWNFARYERDSQGPKPPL